MMRFRMNIITIVLVVHVLLTIAIFAILPFKLFSILVIQPSVLSDALILLLMQLLLLLLLLKHHLTTIRIVEI